ncbi:hypothetical protein [Moellerella wisconsensis]|uniref:hypothetical protein n=1 Tax=Moellerella wisconsensis TaxID=158849 RepID=UPI0030765ED5
MWNIQQTMSDYVLLTQYLSPLDARIQAGLLRTEGITSMLLDENMVWNNQMYSQAVGGVKLLVNKDELTRALDILDKLHQGEFAITDDGEYELLVSQPVLKNSFSDYFNMTIVFLLFFTTGIALPIAKNQNIK